MASGFRTVLGSIALAIALTAAQAASPAAPPAGILVYSAQHAGLTQAWADGFTRETGIPVSIRRGTDTQIANQIVQEGPSSPADVFLTENSPAMMLVDNAGLFAPVHPDTLAQVPAAYRPGDGHWTGIAARTTVFAYNTERLKSEQLPKSMLELSDPGWKGRWGAAPAGGPVHGVVGARGVN
jgi:iron(III) transport system substrate-binding protein